MGPFPALTTSKLVMGPFPALTISKLVWSDPDRDGRAGSPAGRLTCFWPARMLSPAHKSLLFTA